MSDLERLIPYPELAKEWEAERPGYAQLLYARGLPFSQEDPFIFHVLTTIVGADDTELLLDLMGQGARLVPRAEAAERWGSGRGLIFGRDIAAGDDRYIFTTPCHPFSADAPIAVSAPAVAFRLSTVMRLAKGESVGFRVYDLDGAYMSIVEVLAGEPVDEYEGGSYEDEYDEYGEEDMLPSGEAYDLQRAYAVREELEAIAECGTQWDPDKAVALVKLYARMLVAYRGLNPEAASEVQDQIFGQARRLIPRDVCDEVREVFREEAPEALATLPGAVLGGWERLFGSRDDDSLHRLFRASRDKRPEFLVGAHLPLCEAEFYRDAEQRWLPVPEHVCQTGRVAANPPIYIPG